MENGAYQITRLDDGLYALDEGGVRAFLIEGDARAALIDTCFGKGDILAAASALTSKPISLYITHADPDHTGGARAFEEVCIHKSDSARFMSRVPGYAGKMSFMGEGDVIDVSPYRLKVIHVPGHTPGSVALYEAGKRFLISGDTVQLGAVFMFGEGRDIPEYVRSLKKLSALIPEIDIIYPSHGELPITPDVISELNEGARLLRDGKLAPADPPIPLDCKLYSYARARFLAN